MDIKIRDMQKQILGVFPREAKHFALAGGTALELYYLQHRFSSDLDFFSPRYDVAEIKNLISAFEKKVNKTISWNLSLLREKKPGSDFILCRSKDQAGH